MDGPISPRRRRRCTVGLPASQPANRLPGPPAMLPASSAVGPYRPHPPPRAPLLPCPARRRHGGAGRRGIVVLLIERQKACMVTRGGDGRQTEHAEDFNVSQVVNCPPLEVYSVGRLARAPGSAAGARRRQRGKARSLLCIVLLWPSRLAQVPGAGTQVRRRGACAPAWPRGLLSSRTTGEWVQRSARLRSKLPTLLSARILARSLGRVFFSVASSVSACAHSPQPLALVSGDRTQLVQRCAAHRPLPGYRSLPGGHARAERPTTIRSRPRPRARNREDDQGVQQGGCPHHQHDTSPYCMRDGIAVPCTQSVADESAAAASFLLSVASSAESFPI